MRILFPSRTSVAVMFEHLKRNAIKLEELLMGGQKSSRPDGVARRAQLLPVDPVGNWCLACGRTMLAPTGEVSLACEFCQAARSERTASRDDPWPLVRLGRYRGQLRQAILEVKHQRRRDLAHAIGLRLGEQWACVMGALKSKATATLDAFAIAAVQPVPMPLLRRLERGSDHARALADGFAEAMSLQVVSKVRQRWRGPQARLGGAERRQSDRLHLEAADAGRSPNERFEIRRKRIDPRAGIAWWLALRRSGRAPETRTAIIVDDVRTSGATLREIVRLLRATGFEQVGAAVVAVSHDLADR